eukprot:5786534-Alexandrium_andersonii.AAC.1
MSASLVGSEMCIRDRLLLWRTTGEGPGPPGAAYTDCIRATSVTAGFWAVSYTHLTLPTICSV